MRGLDESKTDAMAAELRAIEATGTVDEAGRLSLDEPLPNVGPGRVRLLVLFGSATGLADHDIDERTWLHAGASNPAFDFLSDPAEEVYSPDDGKLFRDEG
jgi:hypothetical protein